MTRKDVRCDTARPRLQEYLDGQLDSAEAQAVEAHLADCSACQKELALWREVDEALTALPVLPEPPDLAERVMSQVRAVPVFRLRWEDALASLAFASSASVLLVSGLLLWPESAPTLRALAHRTWWTVLPRIDSLWHTVRMQSLYVVWGASNLCIAAAAAACAGALAQRQSNRLRSGTGRP